MQCDELQLQLGALSQKLEQVDEQWAGLVADYSQPPASITEFVQSPLYLDLGDEVYPEVLRTLEEIFGVAEKGTAEGRGGEDGTARGKYAGSRYDEVVLCWGIGSGKSYLASLAILYLTHRVLCLRDPQRHFRLSPGSQIALVIMGPSSRQVRRVIYAAIIEMVKRSPWFQRNYPPESVRQEALEFAKHVVIASGNSTDTYVLGYNVMAGIIDEAAYLVESQDGRTQNAEDIYTALQRRIKSRFGTHGLVLIVSSPKHTTDFVEKKLKEAESNQRILGSRKAVWEVKPPERFCGQTFEYKGRQIPIEFYEEFQHDAQRASRDLAAIPLGAYHALFVDMEPLYQSCSEELQHPVIDEHLQLAEWFHNDGDLRPRYVHVDLGLRHDACGIAMAVAEVNSGEPTVTVELMTRFSPPPNGEVDLAKVREFICALRERGFVIGGVSYDGYQSADSQQILRRRGFAVKTVSVDRDMSRYQLLKELATGGRLLLYRYGPFFEEAGQLEIVREQKVDHPRGGSKDVADAVAGAVSEAALAAGRGEIRGSVV